MIGRRSILYVCERAVYTDHTLVLTSPLMVSDRRVGHVDQFLGANSLAVSKYPKAKPVVDHLIYGILLTRYYCT
jgi:hypothetical protein